MAWSLIMVLVAFVGLASGVLLWLDQNHKLPRIQAVKKTPEQESALSRRIAAESLRKQREAEEKAAEKRLEENHKRRQDDLLEFDYRMEALLPHTEHAKKTRLSPRTGCYDCEQQRQADLNQWRWMIERI